MPRSSAPGLGRSFRVLWLSQSASYLGSQVTVVALPLVAVLEFGAGPFEMGLLAALTRLPYLLIGLPAGAMVDRFPRRRVLSSANFALAVTVGAVPVAHIADELTLAVLMLVATVGGGLMVVSDLGFLAIVPELVERDRLTKAQGLIEVTQSIGQLAGPALAGWIVAVASASAAIGVDAATYVAAGAAVLVLRTGDDPPRPAGGSFLFGLRRSAAVVFGQAPLRAVTLANATFVFWLSGFSALNVLFLADRMALPPSSVGFVVALGAVGGLVGAAVAPAVGRWAGAGTTMTGALVVGGVGMALLALADPSGPLSPTAAVTVAAGSQATTMAAFQLFNVMQVPFRYALSPDELHGRVNAMIRTVSWGAAPGGAMLVGLVGAEVGLRAALVIAGVGATVAAGWVAGGPARRVHSVTELVPGATEQTADREGGG